MRRHIHRGHDLDRRITLILFERTGRGADPQEQRDLLHQPEHRVLTRVSGGAEVVSLNPVEFAANNVVDVQFLLGEAKRHLMQPADVLAGYLLECPCDYSFGKDIVQFIGIVDVLRTLTDAEHRRPFRQMTSGEQRIAALIRRNRAAIVVIML